MAARPSARRGGLGGRIHGGGPARAGPPPLRGARACTGGGPLPRPPFLLVGLACLGVGRLLGWGGLGLGVRSARSGVLAGRGLRAGRPRRPWAGPWAPAPPRPGGRRCLTATPR